MRPVGGSSVALSSGIIPGAKNESSMPAKVLTETAHPSRWMPRPWPTARIPAADASFGAVSKDTAMAIPHAKPGAIVDVRPLGPALATA
jgi:hypothetical protein